MRNYLKIFITGIILLTFNITNANYAWNQMANFGGGSRHASIGFSIGSYGYAGTGRGSVDENDIWQYDPSLNTWTQKANYPGLGRYGMIAFSIGNFGYVGTGWSGIGGSGNEYNDFWEYDPLTNIWSQKANFGGSARYAAVGFSIANKGYVGLGYDPIKNDFWEYDPVADAWSQKANFPVNRLGAIGLGIRNKGYVGMGYDLTPMNYNDWYEYDPILDSWSTKSNLPGLSRRACAGFTIGNYGYVGMGYNDTTFMTDFYQYDPISDNWITVASIGGIPRYWVFSFAVDNYGYVGTGSYFNLATPIFTSDFWRFSDCDGTSVGIITNPNPNTHDHISMRVVSDYRKGLTLTYDLGDESDVTFNFYNSLGQLLLTLNLAPGARNMNVPLMLSNEIYLYNVTNSERILSSGKVLVN